MTERVIGIDAERVAGELATLARFSAAPAPAVTRVLFTDADLDARAYVLELAQEAGLHVRTDAMGNTFARWDGAGPALLAVATGSHIDAVPLAGRFDGTVGVIGGIEALRALRRSGFQPRRSIELIVFTSEEPTRFGIGCIGSRVLTGALEATRLAELRDGDGRRFDEVRTAAGCTGPLDTVRLPSGAYHAFVELHIEQGPELERAGVPIGVVTAIAAPAALRIEVTGEGGHAGAVLMPARRDALTGAAEIALAVEAVARGSGSTDSVATTGVFQVQPGAINSIPSRVTLLVDARDIDLVRRDGMVEALTAACRQVAARRSLEVRPEVLSVDPPAAAHPMVLAAIDAAAAEAGLPARRLVSRAYHDSLFMPRLCPTGMIFVPCRGGVSHRSDEYASPDAIGSGIHVLAGTLQRLAGDAA